MRQEPLKLFADLVRQSQSIAVLTGAGISTESGIPDFRSANGLYARPERANVFEIAEFDHHPEYFYDFAREFYPLLRRSQPNAAHCVLASWEKAGRQVQIATQNIADLHQRAGSTRVYPVHGTLLTSTCRQCGRGCATRALEPRLATEPVIRCECGGVFKPDITFFGELLPTAAWDAAAAAMAAADLVLVLGTSLVVYPAAALPDQRAPTAHLVIVNRDPTHLDAAADIVIHDRLAHVLAAVDKLV